MSGKYQEKICEIIPTKDRPQEMRRLLESVREQSGRVDQIIIVDGSRENPVKALKAEFSDLPITYITQDPPGLYQQRIAGLKAVAPEITLVGFLDDDIVLEPGCLKSMREFWDTAGLEVGGAEYNIIHDSSSVHSHEIGSLYTKFRRFIEKLFLVSDTNMKGRILASGIAMFPYPAEQTRRIDWLSGGCNLYRREVFEKYKFDEWYIGWGTGDDLEFSYRVSKEYQLYIVAQGRLQHLPLPVKPGKGYLCGKIITVNHFHFVHKNPEFSRWVCAWANLGQAIAQFLTGLASFNLNNLQRSAGHLAGIYQGLAGSLEPLDHTVK